MKSVKLKNKNCGNIDQDNSEKILITALRSGWTLFKKWSQGSFSFLKYLIDDCIIILFLFSSKRESPHRSWYFAIVGHRHKINEM